MMKEPAIHSPEHWQKLEIAKRLALLMDAAFTIPGTRHKLGLDALLGVLPVAGDLIGFLVSAYIIVLARQMGVSRERLALMALNVVVDAAIGSVPVLGDAVDVFWKANVQNINLMERHLREQAGGNMPKRPRRFGWLPRRKPLPPAEAIIDVVPGHRRTDTF